MAVSLMTQHHKPSASDCAGLQDKFFGPRRALLATADTNVVDVTVEMVASSPSVVPSVLDEVQYSINNYTLEVSFACRSRLDGVYLAI